MSNGKGSRRRPEDAKKIETNWERTFGKKVGPKHPDCVAAMCGTHECGNPGPCYVNFVRMNP